MTEAGILARSRKGDAHANRVKHVIKMDPTRRKLLLAASALIIGEEEVIQEQKIRRPRCTWTRDWIARRNDGHGILSLLQRELRFEDEYSFSNFLRMDKDLFVNLVNKFSPIIRRQETVMRQSISPEDRVAASLRFLASGNSYMDLQYATRIPECTLSTLVPDTLQAIVSDLQDEIKVPSTPSEWEAVADQFHSQWNFPHCIDALDGKHVNFRPPSSSGSYYHNYKGTDSVVLLALVDANYKFLWVNIGVNGRVNDGAIFRHSNLKKAIENGELGLPKPKPMPLGEMCIPYVIVADEAFPLGSHIMKPFPQRGLTSQQRIFNYRLSRARRCVGNAFGILSNRFQILLTKIKLAPHKVDLIVNACVLLHNYIQNRKNHPVVPDEFDVTVHEVQPMRCLDRQGTNRAPLVAYTIRQEFADYFNGVGQVPWQEGAVAKGNI